MNQASHLCSFRAHCFRRPPRISFFFFHFRPPLFFRYHSVHHNLVIILDEALNMLNQIEHSHQSTPLPHILPHTLYWVDLVMGEKVDSPPPTHPHPHANSLGANPLFLTNSSHTPPPTTTPQKLRVRRRNLGDAKIQWLQT